MSQLNTCNARIVSDFSTDAKCNINVENGEYCNIHEYKYRLINKCCKCNHIVNRDSSIPLECGHWYHKDCIWLNDIKECILCDHQLNMTEIYYFYSYNKYIASIPNECRIYNVDYSLRSSIYGGLPYYYYHYDVVNKHNEKLFDVKDYIENIIVKEERPYSRNEINDVYFKIEKYLHNLTREIMINNKRNIVLSSVFTTIPDNELHLFNMFMDSYLESSKFTKKNMNKNKKNKKNNENNDKNDNNNEKNIEINKKIYSYVYDLIKIIYNLIICICNYSDEVNIFKKYKKCLEIIIMETNFAIDDIKDKHL